MKVKYFILIGLLLVLILNGCPSDSQSTDTDQDCSEDSEDAYIDVSLSAAPTSNATIHPSSYNEFETCDPIWVGCTCSSIPSSGCWENSTHGLICNHLSSNCDCSEVEFTQPDCTRSEYVDDNARVCGIWSQADPPSNSNSKHCNGNSNYCTYTDGYRPIVWFAHNQMLQCFVSKYLDTNNGNPNNMNPYFPLPYPSLQINSNRCDGRPEEVQYTYVKGGITSIITMQYAGDNFGNFLSINGVSYQVMFDPTCGIRIGSPLMGKNYCSLNSTTSSTTNSSINST
jgi:hypothetical protein